MCSSDLTAVQKRIEACRTVRLLFVYELFGFFIRQHKIARIRLVARLPQNRVSRRGGAGRNHIERFCREVEAERLFDYYFSKKKLKLKGIKYFSKPISVREIALDLDFIKNKKFSAQYLKSDYRQISKDDFINIRKKANLIKAFPSYLEEISMSFKEFMISTINAVYMMIKNYQNGKQIEIKKFLNILKKFLDEYGINKSLVEIQEFYSRYAIELGFKHLPSRDPDKFVQLYTFSGEKRNFAYISFE